MTEAKEQEKPDKSVLSMERLDAQAFFLKPESYCGIDLPSYFAFGTLLSDVSKALSEKQLSELITRRQDHEGVNYTILTNKDGRHAWRPFQLIHPVLYVELVKQMTTDAHWKTICKRFAYFKRMGATLGARFS